MLDVSNEGMGSVMELLGNRAAIVQSVDPIADRVRITAEIPARQLIGLRSRMLTATQGEAILQHSFLRWDDAREDTRGRVNGVLVASEPGKVTFHAAEQLCQRGILFHEPGDEVYEGQIVGENARDNDLTVNIVKAKAFSNVRENKDATVVLKASRKMTLEEMLEYCERDELVEVTPESLRLRKKLLKEAERRREARHEEAKKAGRFVVNPDLFQSDLQIPRRHVVVFCDDAFGPQSDRWVDLLPEGCHRILPVFDGGFDAALPACRPRVEAFLDAHSSRFDRASSLVVPGGEVAKNDPKVIDSVLASIHSENICRQSFVAIFGGGAVLDAVGFAASIAPRSQSASIPDHHLGSG